MEQIDKILNKKFNKRKLYFITMAVNILIILSLFLFFYKII